MRVFGFHFLHFLTVWLFARRLTLPTRHSVFVSQHICILVVYLNGCIFDFKLMAEFHSFPLLWGLTSLFVLSLPWCLTEDICQRWKVFQKGEKGKKACFDHKITTTSNSALNLLKRHGNDKPNFLAYDNHWLITEMRDIFTQTTPERLQLVMSETIIRFISKPQVRKMTIKSLKDDHKTSTATVQSFCSK